MGLLRLLPRFRAADKALPVMAEREGWERRRIEEWQLRRINAVWEHASRHVPYYRTLCGKRGLPGRFDSMAEFRERMPILEKETLKQDTRALVSERPARGYWVFTGGSTGAPTRTFHEWEAHREMLHAVYRSRAIWDIDICDRTAWMWSRASRFTPGIRGRIALAQSYVADYLRNRMRLSAYRLRPDDLREYLGRMQAFRPKVLYGFSSAIYLLALEAIRTGTRPPDSLKAAFLTSEPLLPQMRGAIEGAFQVPALVEYGAVESGLIAYEDGERLLRVREDIMMVETVPGEAGTFRIVLTRLNNASFPLLRYDIGDLTNSALRIPETGFAVLDRILGRSNDFIISKSGRPVHPEVITHILRPFFSPIRRYRALQAADGGVHVWLEMQPGASLDIPSVERTMSDCFDGQEVTIELTDSIPCTLGGKHRWIISEMRPRAEERGPACAS